MKKTIFSSECVLFHDKKEWKKVCLDLIEWNKSEAIVILSGFANEVSELFDLDDGINLELLWFDCSLAEYKEENIIAKFHDCKVDKKSIQNVIVNNGHDDTALSISVELKCDIEFLL